MQADDETHLSSIYINKIIIIILLIIIMEYKQTMKHIYHWSKLTKLLLSFC